ncbi:MAG: hypothetical protein H0V44_07290 [Planctomycetes bacterium]|nr:hypothetical protein [Planctomycetota bacterium]
MTANDNLLHLDLPLPPGASVGPTGPGSPHIWVLMPASGSAGPATRSAWPTSDRSTHEFIFRCRDGTRSVVFQGRGSTFRERIGFRYIEYLLQHPNQTIAAIDLRADAQNAHRQLYAGSAGKGISTESLVAIRLRCRELLAERDEAQACGDHQRQEFLQSEIERLADEIRRVTGRNGKPRTVDDGERSRIAVTNAIGRAFWSLRQSLPDCEAYLKQTITTGGALAYRPTQELPWEW